MKAELQPKLHEGPQNTGDDIRPFVILAFALRHWRALLLYPLLALLLALSVSFVLPREFTAAASFTPEASGDLMSDGAGLLSLARQIGVGVSPQGASPQFYSELLHSRSISDELLSTTFPDPRTLVPSDSASLVDILEIDGDSWPQRLESGREALHRLVAIDVNSETSLVTVSVETRYRELSAAIANTHLTLLNRFNLETRQTSTRAQREFAADRRDAARTELADVETDLERFLNSNRTFETSPQLRFQYERLQRQVSVKQELFLTLSRAYEEARIREVNNTPTITIIDRAVPPVEKSSPSHVLNAVLGFLAAFALGLLAALMIDYRSRTHRARGADIEELRVSWATFKNDVTRFWKRRRI